MTTRNKNAWWLIAAPKFLKLIFSRKGGSATERLSSVNFDVGNLYIHCLVKNFDLGGQLGLMHQHVSCELHARAWMEKNISLTSKLRFNKPLGSFVQCIMTCLMMSMDLLGYIIFEPICKVERSPMTRVSCSDFTVRPRKIELNGRETLVPSGAYNTIPTAPPWLVEESYKA